MTLKLTLRAKGRNPFNEWQRFSNRLEKPRRRRLIPIEDVIRDGFAANFRNQAAGARGGWRPLARTTILDRLRKGYGPRPILVRTGRLRGSYTRRNNRSSDREFVRRSGGWRFIVGSRYRTARFHELGTFSGVPARKVTPMNPQEQEHIGNVIGDVIEDIRNDVFG